MRFSSAQAQARRPSLALSRPHAMSDGGMDVSDAKRLRSLEDENRKLKKLLAESMLDQAALKELLTKNVWSAPALQGLFFLLSEAACVNVSGLSRVSCCCSQAMMRCARIVPKKWYEQEGLDFLTGLTMRRSTVPTSVLGPRN